MKYLKDAVLRAKQFESTPKTSVATDPVLTGDDKIFAEAVKKAKLNEMERKNDEATPNSASHDKGMFGSRQCKFKQNVWKIPQKPTGDVSQPTGILTQSDLDNYVLYRKDDRLTFKYKSGSAGACVYTASRSGSGEEGGDIKWSDALIQELIDEGALELL